MSKQYRAFHGHLEIDETPAKSGSDDGVEDGGAVDVILAAHPVERKFCNGYGVFIRR